jgi:hypothetical protein
MAQRQRILMAGLLGLVGAALGAAASPAPALADRLESRVLVVPIERGDADAATAETATAAILRGAAAGGAKPTRAQASLADTAAIVGCDPATRPCLDAIGAALNVDQIVYGTLRRNGSQLSLQLTVVARDAEPVTRVVEIERPTAKGMQPVEAEVASLVQGSGAGLTARPESRAATGSRPPVPPKETGPDALRSSGTSPPAVAPSGNTDEEASGFGRIGFSSWLLIGAGAALAAGGTYFWLQANDDQQQIDRAPTETVDDLERLADLEDRAVSHSRWGNGLAIAGGVAIAGGIALAIHQTRAPHRSRVALQPIFSPDSIGLTLTIGGLP